MLVFAGQSSVWVTQKAAFSSESESPRRLYKICLSSLPSKTARTAATNRLSPGAVSVFDELTSKVGSCFTGRQLQLQEGSGEILGPYHPCGHTVSWGAETTECRRVSQPGMHCLKRSGSHGAKASTIHQGAPPEVRASRLGAPC